MEAELFKGFRYPEKSEAAVSVIRGKLAQLAEKLGRLPAFMEVCGTHTVAISRFGIREVLADYVDLLSGPGCPVCVTHQADIDRAIEYARLPGVIVTTFGDMMRVPGSETTLAEQKAEGADIRVVYSPLDALQVAEENPDKHVIFLGIGFETTAPTVAMTLERATGRRAGRGLPGAGVRNFFVYSMHKLVPPVIRALLTDTNVALDGFILPGHVSTILGRKAFAFVADEFGVPAVIAGFEVLDILRGIEELADQLLAGESRVANVYTRAVRETGNARARQVLEQYFRPADVNWRGIGEIPESGLKLREEFAGLDAEKRFNVTLPETKDIPGCACGEVLKGAIKPTECPMFGRRCLPEKPLGPCMVSFEGSCAAYYRYERR